MQFSFYRLRFHFEAKAPMHFGGVAANVLRGAFGLAFRRVACDPKCAGAKLCEGAASCPYARAFEPVARGRAPSGLANPPRPFVFRAAHLDGVEIAAGAPFHFDVNLFDVTSRAVIGDFIRAFDELARAGLGGARSQAALKSVELLDAEGARLACATTSAEVSPLSLSLDPVAIGAPPRIRVRFVTPTELKPGLADGGPPEFSVLLARARDRLSTLSALYASGPLDLDFAAFGRRAAAIRTLRSDLRQVSAARVSSRTGQRHPLGGFTGTLDYEAKEGALNEFIPFLRAAQFTGVGRQTTWGKGEIQIE